MPSTQNDTGLRKQPAELSAAIKPYDDSAQEETEIDLIELFYFLLSKLRWIILAAMLAAWAAGVYIPSSSRRPSMRPRPSSM